MFNVDKNYVIQYLFKDNTKIYKGRYSVCRNPLCTCCNIEFIFDYRNNQQVMPELRVILNVRDKEIVKDHTKTQGDNLSTKLVDDFTYHDWQFLTNLYLEKKTAYTEQSDLLSLDVAFPLDEIQEEAFLVSFNGVLPFAQLVIFSVNGLSLIIEDLYCVQPDCTCNDVHLMISPYYKDNMLFPFLTENVEEMHIVYNIKKNKWTLEEQTELQLNPTDIMTALSEKLDIYKFYSDRYRLIRNLYKKYLHKNIDLIPKVKKISIRRNDPCPCGSGKKYKKCCWGKVI